MFTDYLKLGMDHILDLNGYDHILFVAVLCAGYELKQWKHVLILVTAFTIGHSLTLALSSMDLVSFSPSLIERLIPITIILTGIFNVFIAYKNKDVNQNLTINYLLALGFGLIHGLGFSLYFKAILGSEDSILMPLFAFNVGVELGQLLIVGFIMLLSYIFIEKLKLPQQKWTVVISLPSIMVAIYLLSQR